MSADNWSWWGTKLFLTEKTLSSERHKTYKKTAQLTFDFKAEMQLINSYDTLFGLLWKQTQGKKKFFIIHYCFMDN